MAEQERDGVRRRRLVRLVRPSKESLRLAGLSLVCGAALNLAFAPVGWWPVAPLAVAALSALIASQKGKRGAFIGFWFGTGFCWVMFQWLRVFGPGAQEAVGLLESLYFIPFGWGLARVSGRRFAPLWQACLWVGEEFVRSRVPFGGFSWGRLAFSQPHSPFTPLASLGGAPLLTFAVALSGTLLWRAAAVIRRDRRAGIRWAAALVVGAVAVPLSGLAVPLTSAASGAPLRIALIQGNVPRVGFGREQQQAAVLDNHVAETERLAQDVRDGKAAKPDLVVWPENGSDMDPYTDPSVRAQIQQAVDAVGVPVLIGAVIDADPAGTNVLNRLIVWTPSPGGMGATYDKTHLVPFGEYLPFRSVLTKMIKRFNMIPRDFVPGHGHGTLTLGDVTVAAVMCFEVAYDDVVRQAVNGGGQVLLVPSNNASYMRTGQTYQQLAIARVRAVEHGRWTVEVATSGVSAVIDPHGTVLAQTGEYQAAYLDMAVRRDTGATLADRVGAGPEWVLALAGLFAAVGVSGLAAVAGRTRRVMRKTKQETDSLPVAPSDEKTMPTPERDVPLVSAAKGRAR